jgi:hypothetical protein
VERVSAAVVSAGNAVQAAASRTGAGGSTPDASDTSTRSLGRDNPGTTSAGTTSAGTTSPGTTGRGVAATGTTSSGRATEPRQRRSPVTAPPSARPRGSRKARLRLAHIDPWSVMKTAFLLSIAFGIMCVVAVFIIWSVLTAANVFGSINDSMASLMNQNFAIEDYIGMDRVLSFTMLVAVLNVVLITAIATLCAFIYNLAASLLGGLEVTLAEDDHH